MTDAPDTREITPVHKRCWCYRYGRCLTDCPTADLPFPRSSDGRIAGDAEWHDAYRAVMRAK